MQVYLAFLPMDADSLADSWLNRRVGRMAGEEGAMVHAEIVFREDPEDLYALACSIHYGGTVFVKDKLFSRAGWHFRQISMDQDTAQRCLEWCRCREGDRFNYLGFYARGLPCIWKVIPKDKKKWFCSELVCACLRENGVMNINTCTPHDLYKQTRLTTCPAHPKAKHLELSL